MISLIPILIILIIGFFVVDYISKRDNTLYKDGDYYNQSYGYHSDISVKVVIKNQHINQVLILEDEEPEI